ncbi:hypothetical protein G7Z17_g2610 [Cylindrodendrum hubeiense]|uniref:Nephrocystin 3-like N-terminal domain-containing protein n=1 Tax=Cylindrodendrum hubeiense TaxID=595255 RepID=A0A9P5HCF4_9HYPO|nr:hypothetical protein G7Z17_g2610 [Cylindrodendrum hubeiense]
MPKSLPDFVKEFHEKCESRGMHGKDWQWHERELQRFFKSSLRQVLRKRSVRLFIDALDESGQTTAINIVEQFKSLLQNLPPSDSRIRICFTCRHFPILDWDYGLEITLEQENGTDIATYVKAKLKNRNAQAINIIIDQAAGVFLWAHLVVHRVLQLEREGEGARIKAEIERIPSDLDALYDGLINDMNPTTRAWSQMLIQWICFSRYPLSVDELRWAMAVEPHCSYKSLQQCRQSGNYASDNETMERRIKARSCGLAETIGPPDSRTVQFIHQSVKDFFINKGLSILNAFNSSQMLGVPVIGSAHCNLSRTCICYLSMEEIVEWSSQHPDEQNKNWMMTEFPLLRYAAYNWAFHTSQGEVDGVYQDDLLECFECPSNGLTRNFSRDFSNIFLKKEICLIHVASEYGLTHLLSNYLKRADELGTDIDCRHNGGWSPLLCAVQNRHEVIIRMLLNTGKVNINAEDDHDRTPLFVATSVGCETTVRMLLNTGEVDVNVLDNNGSTPLSLAVSKGYEGTVRMLLDNSKVNVNVKDDCGQTPLWQAAGLGKKVIVGMLLCTGKVDINSRDENGKTPLFQATSMGYKTIVRMLLNSGRVNVNVSDKDGETPLSLAACMGYASIVRMLLDNSKVNVNVKDGRGRTPLWRAAELGNEVIVRMLLCTGKVDINSRDENGCTPLSLAFSIGGQSIIKLVRNTDKVNIDMKDDHGRTQLWQASQSADEDIYKLILDTDLADPDRRYQSGQKLLWEAAREGDEMLVELLINIDQVDIDAKHIIYGQTPLWKAAARGHEAVVKLLLATNRVNINTTDKLDLSPLQIAASNGHDTIVKLILDTRKVEIDAVDIQNLLSWAIARGNGDIGELLLATGNADVNAKDNHGRAPLSLAGEKSQDAIVKLLHDFRKSDR